DVGGENILFDEVDQMFYARISGILHRVCDTQRVEFDADPAGATRSCRGDEYSTIARAQVVHEVCGLYLSQGQHCFDYVVIARYVWHVQKFARFKRVVVKIVNQVSKHDAEPVRRMGLRSPRPGACLPAEHTRST